jgi:hypothetical protein
VQELGGTRKAGSSIIHQAFQGSVQVTTRPFKPKEDDTQTAARNKPNGAVPDKDHEDPITVENLPFLYAPSALQPPPSQLQVAQRTRTLTCKRAPQPACHARTGTCPSNCLHPHCSREKRRRT